MSLKSYIYGYDGLGWSVDSDAYYTRKLLKKADIEVVNTPLGVDVVHFVWWNQALRFRHLKRISFSKWMAVVTNTITENTPGFTNLLPVVDCWVAANRTQLAWFHDQGITCAYQPFFVDSQVFAPKALSRLQLCHELGIDFELVRDKFLIGSFQRDSLGANLSMPKWQKGPDLLVQILAGLPRPRTRWCLILAGPRRHWLIEQCREERIPFVYVGTFPAPGVDDILCNNLSREKMALLYNLVDLYLVSSRMEGGPKAVLEAALCKTPVLSTKVGLAPDMLPPEALFTDAIHGRSLLKMVIERIDRRRAIADISFKTVNEIMGEDSVASRWKIIYNSVLGKSSNQ